MTALIVVAVLLALVNVALITGLLTSRSPEQVFTLPPIKRRSRIEVTAFGDTEKHYIEGL
jgi:hypothetical protein